MFNWLGLVYLILFMAFFHYIVNKYDYMPSVFIYAVGRGLLPSIIPYTGILNILVNTVIRFVIGLLFVKLFTKFTYNFEDYRVIIMIGSVLEFLITLGLSIVVAAVIYNF